MSDQLDHPRLRALFENRKYLEILMEVAGEHITLPQLRHALTEQIRKAEDLHGSYQKECQEVLFRHFAPQGGTKEELVALMERLTGRSDIVVNEVDGVSVTRSGDDPESSG